MGHFSLFMDSGLSFSDNVIFSHPLFKQHYLKCKEMAGQKNYGAVINSICHDPESDIKYALHSIDRGQFSIESFMEQCSMQAAAFFERSGEVIDKFFDAASGVEKLHDELLYLERGIRLMELVPENELKVMDHSLFQKLELLRKARQDKRNYLAILEHEQRKIGISRTN